MSLKTIRENQVPAIVNGKLNSRLELTADCVLISEISTARCKRL